MRKLQVITCVSPNWSLLLLAGNQMPVSTQERLLVLKFRVSVFKPKDHIDHNYINIKGGSEWPCSICFGRIVVISDTTWQFLSVILVYVYVVGTLIILVSISRPWSKAWKTSQICGLLRVWRAKKYLRRHKMASGQDGVTLFSSKQEATWCFQSYLIEYYLGKAPWLNLYQIIQIHLVHLEYLQHYFSYKAWSISYLVHI